MFDNDEMLNAIFLVLSNNFDEEMEIRLTSFNASLLANDEIFTILLNFFSLTDDNQDKLSNLSILIINQIFERTSTRDFISLEIYENIFDYIISYPYRIGKLFSSIILQIEQIDPQFYPVIIEILSIYMENTNPISNPNLYVAIFGLSKLLMAEIEVPQELLLSCEKVFVSSADEKIITCILYIMMMFEEPPIFAFPKILDTIKQYDKDIGFIAIKVITKFCMDWTDEQKDILIEHILNAYPNLYYKSSNYAMYILLKLMKPLPSEPDFFSILINGIETCDYKPLSIACAEIIIQNWSMSEIDEEKMSLINDFQNIIERLVHSEDESVATMSQKTLYSIEMLLSEEKA